MKCFPIRALAAATIATAGLIPATAQEATTPPVTNPPVANQTTQTLGDAARQGLRDAASNALRDTAEAISGQPARTAEQTGQRQQQPGQPLQPRMLQPADGQPARQLANGRLASL